MNVLAPSDHFDWGEDIIADITVKVVGFWGAGRFISRLFEKICGSCFYMFLVFVLS